MRFALKRIVDNSLDTLKILMFIDNLNLEHTRMKKTNKFIKELCFKPMFQKRKSKIKINIVLLLQMFQINYYYTCLF